MAAPASHLTVLQVLRALAALMVVVFHSGERVRASLPEPLGDALRSGAAGVDLFFVISGFVMWISAAGETPGRFMAKRIARILPLYWIMTLAWVALAAAAQPHALAYVVLEGPHILASLAFVPAENPGYLGRIWPVLIPGWTLNFEMAFYLLFAACLWLPARWRLAACIAALLAGAGLSQAIVPPVLASTLINPLMLEFAFGLALGRLYLAGALPRGRTARLLAAVGALALLASSLAPDLAQANRALVWGGPAALITAGCLGGWRPTPGLLTRIGDASYALYLGHLFVLTILLALWQRLPEALPAPVMGGLYIAIGILLSVRAGGWLHIRVEKPASAWARRQLVS